MNKKVVVMGIGYVGLPLTVMLAKSGYQVIGVDIDSDRVRSVNSGLHLHDEDEIVKVVNEPEMRRNLRVQDFPCEADVFVIAVPTPLEDPKRVADLSFVLNALDSIIPYLRDENLIIIESTVPPLTCRGIIAKRLETNGFKIGENIFLAHCPERILPGDVFREIVQNDRIIGGLDRRSCEMAKEVYLSFVKGEIIITDDITAETVKLMENTYRDVNIALANEFALVCENLGIDVMQCISIANKHPRVDILNPGIGTGGHCIPVDPWFIHQTDPLNSRLIYTARMVNEGIPSKICSKIRKLLKDMKNPKILAVGMSYKPDVSDTRNSPAIQIIHELRSEGYQVVAYDPLVQSCEFNSLEDAVRGVDCLVILVEHESIREELMRNEDRIKANMRTPFIVRFYQEINENEGRSDD